MCGLTTEWILESAQSLACALIRRTFYALERRTTHSSEWEGTQTLRRERQAHRWPSGWGEQCWLDQQGERPITELWGAEKLGRSEGSGMLIGDPPVEGSSASSTDGEPWRAENSFLGMRGTQLPMRSSRAENSFLRMRGKLRRSAGSGMLKDDPLLVQNDKEQMLKIVREKIEPLQKHYVSSVCWQLLPWF